MIYFLLCTHKFKLCNWSISKLRNGDKKWKWWQFGNGDKIWVTNLEIVTTCENCDKIFALNSNLVRHLKTHEEKKLFKCENGSFFTKFLHCPSTQGACFVFNSSFLESLIVSTSNNANFNAKPKLKYFPCTKYRATSCSSKIKNLTVFFSGAQITRTAKIKAPKGKHRLVLNELPNTIYDQSIQVKSTENCKILSVKHELVYPSTKKSSAEKVLENKIESLELEMKSISNQFNVFTLEQQLLSDNRKLNKNKEGSAIEDIKKAADFYLIKKKFIWT